MSKSVSFKFRLKLVSLDPNLLDAKLEREPYVYAYFSRKANPGSQIVAQAITLGQDSLSYNLFVPTETDLMENETLSFDLYSRRKITNDNTKRFQGYSRFIPLASSSISWRSIVVQQNTDGLKEIPIFFYDPSAISDEEIFKSRAECRLVIEIFPLKANYQSFSSDNERQQRVVVSSSEITCDRKVCNGIESGENCKGLIGTSFFDFYAKEYINVLQHKIKPSEIGCQSVHVPYWKTIYGNLLAPTYLNYLPRERLNEDFLLYCLDIVLSTNNVSRTTFEGWIGQQLYVQPNVYMEEMAMVGSVIVETAALFANACDYLPDLSMGQMTERFIDIQETGVGDCEDDGKHIQVMLELWKRALTYLSNSCLRHASMFLQYYKITLGTTDVTSASASSLKNADGSSMNTNENQKYMCHICCLMIPNQYYNHVLLRNKSTRHLGFEYGLALYMGEGTNYVQPKMLPMKRYVSNPMDKAKVTEALSTKERRRIDIERRYPNLCFLSNQAQQTNINDNIRHPSEFCSFYKKVNEIWIDSNDGKGPLPYELLDKRGEYGVWIQELFEKNENLSLYKMYEYNPEDVVVINSMLDKMQPMRTLSFKPNLPPAELRNIIISKNPQVFDRLNQITTMTFSNVMKSSMKPSHYFVSPFHTYYINHSKKITPELLNDLERLIKQRNDSFVISKFEYFIHPLSDDGEIYFIEFRLYVV